MTPLLQDWLAASAGAIYPYHAAHDLCTWRGGCMTSPDMLEHVSLIGMSKRHSYTRLHGCAAQSDFAQRKGPVQSPRDRCLSVACVGHDLQEQGGGTAALFECVTCARTRSLG